MEGVPRIPMMSFPMRRSADTPHFKSRLKSFISNHYNEDPESYANEIHDLETLRASAVHVSKDYSGCSTLKKYFCQLNFLKSRFPMNEGGTCAISFSWYDVFSETVHGWSDVDFEMSCALYNIGALHSELGALDNRQTAEGMKTSCTHFQCAAWAFSHLRHNYQKFFTPDVSPDMLNILMNICLAQAQECILEKSLIDNRKSTITAKVALQIVEYYSTALRIIDGMQKDAAQYSEKLIKAVKKWRKLVELKVQYYGCIAYLYRGMQAEDQSKWGERVTMYKAAAEKMNECIKLGKNLEKTDPVHDTLHFTLDVVGGKVVNAEKENEFIYHEKIPELEAVMSDVKAVSLVKGIQFKFDDPQVAGPDIFGRLVPMEAHEASSLYSEEKAKILRTYSRKIEEKNEALDKFILPLQLEQLELHDSDKIPQELIDCCAALSVNKDAVKRLSDLMANLSGLFHDVEANLEEIQDHLAEQDKKEKEYQEVVGKRPPNNIINEIVRELEKYQSAQAVAAESNKSLHETMVNHVANLSILLKPLNDVMDHIPKFDELEKNEEAFERMRKLSGKVSEMRKQREMLEGQLRDSILNDDITKSLVVKKDEDLETVFKDELEKHDKITQLLDQNLLAQENIVRALTEANAEYAETRLATVELKRKRDTVIQSMIGSYEAYDELTSKCNFGIEFYTKMNANVEKLLQRVRSVCKVQNEEREINMERIIRKAQKPPAMPPVMPGMQSNIGGVGGTGTNAGTYNNSMMPGAYPGYPGTTMASQIPPPSAFANVTPNSLPSTRLPSSGGHLKLKDYLAMKKEGQTAASIASSMMRNEVNASQISNTAPLPQVTASYDPHTGYQLQQPMVSSITTPLPVPPVIPASHYPAYDPTTGQPFHNSFASTTPTPAAAPMSHAYDANAGQPMNHPMAPQTPTPPPPVSHHVPTYNPSASAGQQYQQIHQPTVSSTPTPTPSVPPQFPGYNPSVGQQQQLHYPMASSPAAPAAGGYPGTGSPHNPYSGTNGVNKVSSPGGYSSYQQQQQHPPAQPQPQTPQSSYNNYNYKAPSYYPSSAATPPPPHSQPQQQSTNNQIPAATAYPQPTGGYYPGQQQQPYNAANSVGLGSGQQQQPYNAANSGGVSAGQQQQPYNAGNSVGLGSGQQQQPYNGGGVSVGQQQQPYNAANSGGVSTGQQQPYSAANSGGVSAGQQQPYNAPNSSGVSTGQQQPYNAANPGGVSSIGQSSQPSDIDKTSYSQTSFLAQYVRQNQGYLSSNSNQTPSNSGAGASTFPSFGGGTASNSIGYSQQMGYGGNAGYGQQPDQNQFPGGYGQQQWQPPQTSQPSQQSQQIPTHPNTDQQASYPSSQPPPQQYQQYGITSEQQHQQIQAPSNYYNAAAPTAPQQQTMQSVPYQQNQTPYQQQPPQQSGTTAPMALQAQPKPVRNSNFDLLSDIDFNALPAAEPLAPVVLPQATNSSTSTQSN